MLVSDCPRPAELSRYWYAIADSRGDKTIYDFCDRNKSNWLFMLTALRWLVFVRRPLELTEQMDGLHRERMRSAELSRTVYAGECAKCKERCNNFSKKHEVKL